HRRPQSRDHPQQPDDGHGAAAQRQPEHARDAQGSRGAGTVIRVRPTRPEDFPSIHRISRAIYPDSPAWSDAQLTSHLAMSPEGQLVAGDAGGVVGMAASLVVLWDDYSYDTSWREFTDHGMFTNHDPVHGRTLYGAEIMVDPARQGQGIGKALYQGRRDICRRLRLLRIRAGARLAGYHRY